MGHVIKLRPEQKQAYIHVHENVWPEILQLLADVGIRNYSIFLREPENLLFAYWEYHGEDFAHAADRISAHPRMNEWWQITDPMQERLMTVQDGEHWAPMTQVFFTDSVGSQVSGNSPSSERVSVNNDQI